MGNTIKRVIAFDAKRLFLNYTGLGNYSRTLVRNLATYFPEHEYHLFTPEIKENADTAWFLESGRFAVHVPSRPNPLWRPLFMAREINALRPDLFHGLSHEIPFGLQSSIATVVTFHDLIYLLYPAQFGFWDRWMYRFKYKSAAQRAGTILAISQSTAKDLQHWYQIKEEKIRVVYQSCQDVFQESLPTTGPASIPALPAEPYFLYVGSIIPRKGLDCIVQAYAQLPPACRKPVVVVGGARGIFADKVRKLIGHYNLQDSFYFVPHVSNAGLVEIYDRSYALLYPSQYEGFGIPVIESLFRGRPVITSTISSMPEASGPGALLVEPGNVPMLCGAMKNIQEKDTYASLAKSGKAYVSDHFRSQVTAESLMSLYETLLVSSAAQTHL